MVPTVTGRESSLETTAQRERFLKALQTMILARIIEEKLAGLYRAGKIAGGVYLGRGQEAVSVSLGLALRKGDVFAPLIRDSAGRLAFGETMLDGFRTYLGSTLGPMRGRDGNIHRGRPRDGLLPMISHLGAMISVVSGILISRRFQRIEGTVGATCLGEGGTSTGSFHEALNQAAVEKLPLVLVVANNQYAYSTPTSKQFACRALVDKAVGYGVEGCTVDGTELSACLETMAGAVERARSGHGPQLVVAKLLRLCGHGEHDDASYVDPKLRNSALGRDCVKVAEEHALRKEWIDAAQVESWRREAHEKVDETAAMVQREPLPDPFNHDWSAISSRHLLEMHPEPAPLNPK